MMRAAFALAILIGMTSTAFSGSSSPVIVIPGRLGVPVIINGVDASYAVVEGDWGLGKGIHVQPTVYGGRFVDPEPHVGHYYPSSGHAPGYGRLEIEPPSSGKPRPAESFHQSWSAESMPQPPQPAVPLYPPPVINAPQYNEPGISPDFANPQHDFRDQKPRKPRQ
ncbi:MAG TPA: hypothetical protein VFE56_00210 [Candidatus Binataceae bacterium]|jgi:hypothetical protein|nr:hypothetical protein [Candidatus Binataceae bacterium]